MKKKEVLVERLDIVSALSRAINKSDTDGDALALLAIQQTLELCDFDQLILDTSPKAGSQ